MNLFLKKLFNHLSFRFQQFFRIGNLNPNLGGAFAVQALFLIFVNLNKSVYYQGVFLLPILFLHFRRKDVYFLKKIFFKSWRLVLLIEYFILLLIFNLSNIHYKLDYFVIISLLGVCFLPLLHISNNIKTFNFDFISNKTFEWKSFLRKQLLTFLIYYLLTIISSYHPFTLLLMGTFFLDFISNIFTYNENKELLEAYFKKYSLKQKLYFNAYLLNLLLLPILIGYIIFNSDEIIYLLYYFIFMNLYYLLIITRKYKNYYHKNKENEYNMGIYLQYLLSSLFIIPAFYFLKQNISSSIQKIKSYARNK